MKMKNLIHNGRFLVSGDIKHNSVIHTVREVIATKSGNEKAMDDAQKTVR
jgi:hypothetical protein